jgi:hypothetical protein
MPRRAIKPGKHKLGQSQELLCYIQWRPCALFLPSSLEFSDERIDAGWNKEGRKSGMDIAKQIHQFLESPCSIFLL